MNLDQEDVEAITISLAKKLDRRENLHPDEAAERHKDLAFLRRLRKKAEARANFRKGVWKQAIGWAVVAALTGAAAAVVWIVDAIWDKIQAILSSNHTGG